MTYKATLSGFTRGITFILLAVLFGWFGFVAYISYTQIPNATPFGFVGLVLLAITVGITYMYMPTSYELTDRQLIINRRAGARHIDLRQISACSQAEGIPMLRLFGSGGLFGHLGLYYSSSMGRVWLYCTRRENLVLIHLADDLPIILSPDEDILFVSDLNSRI